MKNMLILAGDIGGTKTHLALYEGRRSIAEEKYPSQDYKDLSEILQIFLSLHKRKVERACLGIAGPIQNGCCRATNLPWVVDAAGLSKSLKIDLFFLINDLEANAYGLRVLSPKEFALLNAGEREREGNAALISAGTGLGEAGLYWDGKEHHPFACEGGHVDFAPRDDLEIALLKYLKDKFGHVSYERILSGPGLRELFHFLINTGLEKTPEWFKGDEKGLSQKMTEHALNGTCSLSVRIVDWFASLYGSEAGNLALKFLARSGVYLGGGIAPKILPILQRGEFMRAFCLKGRFQELLSKIPVKVVLNENAALLGAVNYAERPH
jgi:glucokinase